MSVDESSEPLSAEPPTPQVRTDQVAHVADDELTVADLLALIEAETGKALSPSTWRA